MGGRIFLNIFFFGAPPPCPSELESSRSSPTKSLHPLARLHSRNKQDTKDLDCDPISTHPIRERLQVVSTNKANKARYGQKTRRHICAIYRKLGPILYYFLYIYIYIIRDKIETSLSDVHDILYNIIRSLFHKSNNNSYNKYNEQIVSTNIRYSYKISRALASVKILRISCSERQK